MKKPLVLLLLCCVCLNVFARRSEICLSGGGWQFCLDPLKKGDVKGYPLSLPSPSIVHVPHTWGVDPDMELYRGTAWYSRTFDIRQDWIGKTIRLRFNAVSRDAVIYVNGREAGRHMNSAYTQFYVDITDFVVPGGNTLTLSVNNEFSDTALPYINSYDWTDDGGRSMRTEVHRRRLNAHL